jgi:mannosyltransferase
MPSRARAWLERIASTPLVPVILAVVLGLYRAGEKSIWLDEAVSVSLARLPTLDLLLYLWRTELHAAPYYLALHPWLALGDSEAAVRSLSVVFGVVTVLATFAIGRRFGVGFAAALIVAVSPTFVQYEQEARGYTMLMAASAVSTLLFLRLVEQPNRWRAALYALSAGAIIYVHPLGALVVVAHGLSVLAFVPRPLKWRLSALFVPVAVLWLPMLRFALLNRDRISWVPETTPSLLLEQLILLGGGIVAAGLVLVMIGLGMRRDPIALWLLVPIVGTVLISVLVQPTLLARYLVAAVPAGAVVAARSRALLVAALVAVSLVGAWNWYEHGQKEDWQSLAAWVAGEARPDDGIVIAPAYLRSPFGYYARVGRPIYPAVPWSRSDLERAEPDMAALAASQRVWLIERHTRELPADLRAALDAFSTAETRIYEPHGIRATLLIRQPSGP